VYTFSFMKPDTTPPVPHKDADLGITFTEVHSDEPHTAVNTSSVSSAPHKEKRSHLSNQGDVFHIPTNINDQDIEEGTIISDKKRKHSSFFQSVKEAFGEWQGNVKKNISNVNEKVQEKKQSQEKPRIEPALARKETIEKAATYSHIAPKADSRIIIEKVHTYNDDVSRITGKPAISKHESPNPHINTPLPTKSTPSENRVSSVQSNVFRNNSVAPIVPQKIQTPRDAFIKKETPPAPAKSFSVPVPVPEKVTPIERVAFVVPPPVHAVTKSPEVHEPKFAEPIKKLVPEVILPVPKPPSTVANIPEPKIPEPDTVETPKPIAEEVSPKIPEPVIEETKPIPDPVPLPERPEPDMPTDIQPAFRSTPLPDKAKQDLESLKLQNNDPVSQVSIPQKSNVNYVLLSLLVVAIIFGGIGFGFLAKNMINTDRSTENPGFAEFPRPVSPDGETGRGRTLEVSGSRDAFMESLYTLVHSSSDTTTSVSLYVREGNISRPATSKEFIGLLNTDIPPRMLSVLSDEFTVGSVVTSTREPFLILRSNNFDLLFSGMLEWEDDLAENFAPLFNVQSVTDFTFKDAVRVNVPTRILYDQDGSEVITYAFVGKNTVVITQSSAALTLLIPTLTPTF